MAELEKEKKSIKETGKGRGRMFLGLVLVVLAVLLYCYRNGYFKSPQKTSDEEYLAGAVVKRLETVNEIICSEYILRAEGRGTAVGEVSVSKDYDEGIFIWPEALDSPDGEKKLSMGYEGSVYSIKDALSGVTLFDFDEGDVLDLSKAGSKSAAKKEKIKKLLEKYESLFFGELFKNAVLSSNDNFINVLDSVLLVEKKTDVRFTADDVERAFLLCAENARKDRKLQKAYMVLSTGKYTYEEALDLFEKKVMDRSLKIFENETVEGAFYINVSEGLTMAELTAAGTKADGGKSTERIKAGFTYLNREAGFVLEYEKDGEILLNIHGSGICNTKSKTLNATGKAFFKGERVKAEDGVELDLVLQDLMPVNSGELYLFGRVRASGDTSLFDDAVLLFDCETGLQSLEVFFIKDGNDAGGLKVSVVR